MSESTTQQSLVRWFALAHRGLKVPSDALLMASPLQAARTPRNGARMKAEGARKGTPDLFLAVARGGCHGLYLEMKSPTGRVSPEQAAMLDLLHAQNYATVVARSFDTAQAAIELYLRGSVERAPVSDPWSHHD